MGEQKRVTVMGGGQLCGMLALAARKMGGVIVTGFDPQPDACAGQECELVVGKYTDEWAIGRAIEGADVVTYEFENVPHDALLQASLARIPVYPPVKALLTAQDRLLEKELALRCGFPTASFRAVDEPSDLIKALDVTGYPAVIKTRRNGYDGKGQRLVRTRSEAEQAFRELGGRDLIVEAFVEFESECSMIVVRGSDASMECYPLIENHHRDGILRVSRMNKTTTSSIETDARMIARRFAEALEYVGVLTVEFFLKDGVLLVNEMAPRVHNSGHWSMEGAETSQFENHLRAILGMPIGSTEAKGFAGMVNCIGRLPDTDAIRAAVPDAYIHFYGKEPRRDRKLGHITVCCSTYQAREGAIEQLVRLCDSAAAAA